MQCKRRVLNEHKDRTRWFTADLGTMSVYRMIHHVKGNGSHDVADSMSGFDK